MKRAKNEIDRNKRGREKLFDRSTGPIDRSKYINWKFLEGFRKWPPPRIRPKRVILFFLLFSFPFKFTPGVLLQDLGRIEVIEKLSCPPLCFIAF